MALKTSCPKPKPREKAKRKPVKRVNRKRKASEFARCYGSDERVQWVSEQWCVVRRTGVHNYLCATSSKRHNAHIETGGAGRKADADKIVPLCPYHHRMLDETLGRTAFERMYKISLMELAAETERLWQLSQASNRTHP